MREPSVSHARLRRLHDALHARLRELTLRRRVARVQVGRMCWSGWCSASRLAGSTTWTRSTTAARPRTWTPSRTRPTTPLSKYVLCSAGRRGPHTWLTRPALIYVYTAQGSITSPDLVAFLLRDKHVDTIMHFAAQSHVGTPPARPRPPPHAALCPDHDSSLQRFLNTIDRSFESSFDFTHDNVLGTHVLLEAARVRASRAVAAALLILIVRSVTGRAPVARSTASSASST